MARPHTAHGSLSRFSASRLRRYRGVDSNGSFGVRQPMVLDEAGVPGFFGGLCRFGDWVVVWVAGFECLEFSADFDEASA
jgi:hypothetical protein